VKSARDEREPPRAAGNPSRSAFGSSGPGQESWHSNADFAPAERGPSRSTTRDELVDLLAHEGAETIVSGAALARRLGISRNAVWKQVKSLRSEGWDVETVPSRGYRLNARPDVLDESAIRRHLKASTIGRRLVCLPVTGSTNDDAARAARGGEPEGTVVIADAQTAGRGRLGRSWVSVRGLNLCLSVVLRPRIVPAAAPQLSLVAGLAVAAAMESEGLQPLIKWPNDVLLAGRKACGILTELEAEADRVGFVIVGIGVNVNGTLAQLPTELHDKATSMYLALGRRVDRARFAARLLDELESRFERFLAGGFAVLADEWNRRSALTGRAVTVSGAATEAVSGTCAGIDADGALLLHRDGGPVRVLAGDVTIAGGYD
jgi:BirA family biotin operon repressor/biotin-[acetyl-CoA-carboxylase] ligase